MQSREVDSESGVSDGEILTSSSGERKVSLRADIPKGRSGEDGGARSAV